MTITVPSEFVGFVRNVGTRALDKLAEQLKELDPPLRAVVRSWSKLSATEKRELFDRLIDAARDDPPPEKPKRAPSKRRKTAS